MTTHDFTPIFLLYVSRSGSTFLAENLAKCSPDVCVMPEFEIFKPLVSRGADKFASSGPQDWSEWIFEDARAQNTGFTATQLAEAFEQDGCRSIPDAVWSLMRFFRDRNCPNAQYVLIKKGSHMRFIDYIVRQFPGSRYLMVYRDPRAVVRSQISQSRTYTASKFAMGRGDVRYISNYWRNYIIKFSKLQRTSEQSLEIQYEKLVSDTPNMIKGIGEWLGCAVTDEALPHRGIMLSSIEAESLHKRVKQDADKSRIDFWKTELSPEDVFIIEDVCEGEMQSRGYNLYQKPQTTPLRSFVLRGQYRLRSLWIGGKYYLERLHLKLRNQGIRRVIEMIMLRIRYRP